MMHVIVAEGLCDRGVRRAPHRGVRRARRPRARATRRRGPRRHRRARRAHRRRSRARYAATRPAMIVLGGSSHAQGRRTAGRARARSACLPALTGNLGIPGGGLGPRHGSGRARPGPDRHRAPASGGRPGDYVPNQMPRVTEALVERPGARAAPLRHRHALVVRRRRPRRRRASARADLVVSHDLFLNDTARRFADVVLPAHRLARGARLQEHQHASLPDGTALRAAGRDAPGRVGAARARAAARTSPTSSRGRTTAGPLDAILDHPATGHATVAALRAEGGMRALRISHVGHPDLAFPTPSGKVELVLGARRRASACPPLPVHEAPAGVALSRSRSSKGARSRTSTASTIMAARCRRWPRLDPEPGSGSRPPTRPRAGWRTARRSASTTSAARCAPARG